MRRWAKAVYKFFFGRTARETAEQRYDIIGHWEKGNYGT